MIVIYALLTLAHPVALNRYYSPRSRLFLALDSTNFFCYPKNDEEELSSNTLQRTVLDYLKHTSKTSQCLVTDAPLYGAIALRARYANAIRELL